MRPVRIQFILLFLAAVLLGTVPAVHAQEAAPIMDQEIAYFFGDNLTFQAFLNPELDVAEVALIIDLVGAPLTIVVEGLEIEGGVAIYRHDLGTQPIPAFSTLKYRYRLTLADETITESKTFSFLYADNRFNWDTLQEGSFRVHWYAGDLAFAQEILDAAEMGVENTREVLQAILSGPVDIYIYGSFDEYQFARGELGQRWAGGHADPQFNLVLLSLPPGPEQSLQIERKIPHEIAHIALYQAAPDGYANIPTWLNEGFASLMETFPNPDYRFLVTQAQENGTLIPIADLCPPFPRDASRALLSYAESTEFLRFIQSAYGPAGIRALVAAYAGGAGCEQGTRTDPINLSLSELENQWVGAPIQANPIAPEAEAVQPWLVVAALTIAGPVILIFTTLSRRQNKPAQPGGA
jgi:hypothetical protein